MWKRIAIVVHFMLLHTAALQKTLWKKNTFQMQLRMFETANTFFVQILDHMKKREKLL